MSQICIGVIKGNFDYEQQGEIIQQLDEYMADDIVKVNRCRFEEDFFKIYKDSPLYIEMCYRDSSNTCERLITQEWCKIEPHYELPKLKYRLEAIRKLLQKIYFDYGNVELWIGDSGGDDKDYPCIIVTLEDFVDQLELLYLKESHFEPDVHVIIA